jgi:hypothetical protein
MTNIFLHKVGGGAGDAALTAAWTGRTMHNPRALVAFRVKTKRAGGNAAIDLRAVVTPKSYDGVDLPLVELPLERVDVLPASVLLEQALPGATDLRVYMLRLGEADGKGNAPYSSIDIEAKIDGADLTNANEIWVELL